MKPSLENLTIISLLVLLLLGGCVTAPKSTSSPSPTRETPPASAKSQPTETATIAITPTVILPCSPDYCIEPGNFPFSRPIQPPATDRVDEYYRYGYTQSGTRDPHHGVEFNNPEDTPVLAAADGKVIFAGNDTDKILGAYPGFYGNLVLLQHDLPGYDTPVYTLYGHLSSIAVKTGDRVSRGEGIGTVGLTGSAIGAHLHFETRLAGPGYSNTVNPELFFPPLPLSGSDIPTGILVGRIEDQFGDSLRIPLTIQPLAEDGSLGAAIYPEIYGSGVPSSPSWKENFLVSGLPVGTYRLAFINYSKVFERTVEVIPGGVTFVKIQATP